MKKITKAALGITSVALITIGLIGMSQLNAGNKVKLHHGSQIIEVSTRAAAAHLSHGDIIHDDGYTCACD